MPSSRIPRKWLIVAALSLTTTAGYGVLAYAFAVLLVPMQEALDATRALVVGSQTAGLLAGALAAVAAGRWLDRWGARALMIGGSVAATALVYLWSRVDSVAELYLVSIGLGFAGAGVLYEAAFAVVVRWFDHRQRGNAILAITIVGGLASTIFFPLTGFLVESFGWRQALVTLAVIYGVVTIPLHLLVRNPRGDEGFDFSVRQKARAGFSEALRDKAFWLLAAAFVIEGGANAVIGLHLVAYLIELGHPPTLAATIAGLLGLLSVTGRLVTTFLQRKRTLTVVVAVIFAVQAVGASLLPMMGGSVFGAIGCVVAFGIGTGVATIARPVMLAERYSLRIYATLAGLISAMMMVMKAVAPLGASVLYGLTDGYTAVMLACAIACLLGVLALFLLGRARQADAKGTDSAEPDNAEPDNAGTDAKEPDAKETGDLDARVVPKNGEAIR